MIEPDNDKDALDNNADLRTSRRLLGARCMVMPGPLSKIVT